MIDLNSQMKIGGVIVAGGTGKRYGGDIPKQFLALGDKSILEYSIEKFSRVCDELVVVCHKEWLLKAQELITKKRNIILAEGGQTRQLSVYNGLSALHEKNISIVAIHDSVRPLFSVDLLKRCIKSAEINGSGVPAIQTTDTLAYVENQHISYYVDRLKILQIQTPQVFQFDLIWKAHSVAYKKGDWNFPDDSGLFEIINKNVDIVNGEETNIKITTPLDRLIALEILSRT